MSSSLVADTFCLASIHLSARSRSSFGRFITKAATAVFRRSHQTLKLLLVKSLHGEAFAGGVHTRDPAAESYLYSVLSVKVF